MLRVHENGNSEYSSISILHICHITGTLIHLLECRHHQHMLTPFTGDHDSRRTESKCGVVSLVRTESTSMFIY